MDATVSRRLSRLVLATKIDAFRPALPGEPAAEVQLPRIKSKPDESMRHMTASPLQVAPGRWNGSRAICSSYRPLAWSGLVDTTRSSIMAVPKDRGWRIVTDYRGVNGHGVNTVANADSSGDAIPILASPRVLFFGSASGLLKDAVGRRFLRRRFVFCTFRTVLPNQGVPGHVEGHDILPTDHVGDIPGEII